MPVPGSSLQSAEPEQAQQSEGLACRLEVPACPGNPLEQAAAFGEDPRAWSSKFVAQPQGGGPCRHFSVQASLCQGPCTAAWRSQACACAHTCGCPFSVHSMRACAGEAAAPGRAGADLPGEQDTPGYCALAPPTFVAHYVKQQLQKWYDHEQVRCRCQLCCDALSGPLNSHA